MYKQKILLFALALVLTCLVFAGQPQWTPMTGNEFVMPVFAKVNLYELPFNNDNPLNILAAFGPGGVNDCRAIAVWDEIDQFAMWYLTVRSNAILTDYEEINFMIYDAQADSVYECKGDSLVYFANSSDVGSLYEPHQLYAPADLPPVSLQDAYDIEEDILLDVGADDGVLANDYDPDGLDLNATLISDVAHGVLEFYSDGSFNYQSDLNFYGSDQFTYQASDSLLVGEETIVDITILPVNDPPQFQFFPTEFSFDEDSDLIEDFNPYILDPEGDAIDSLSVLPTDNINIDITGLVVRFSADANWFGSELVTFQATDIYGASITQDVLITVDPLNDPPVIDILFEQFEMIEDTPDTLDLTQYISDIDIDDQVTLSVDDNDNISVEIDGYSVTLIPDDNWFGSEVLNFIVSDGVSRLTDNDFVEIIVESENDAPVINIPQEEYSFNEDELLLLDISDYIYDVDDSDLSISFSGNIELNFEIIAPAVYNITAPKNWFGSELITFAVTDTSGLSDTDTVTINVISVPDRPVIQLPDSFPLNEDENLVVDFEAMGYIYDVDSDSLALEAEGVNITVIIDSLIVEFIPLPDWNGSEIITFTVYDETLMAEDFVEVIVNPVNDSPTIDIDDSYTFNEDESLLVNFAPYINDIDLDIITLSVSGDSLIQVNFYELMVTFSSQPDWFGSEILTFTVNDNQGRAIASDTTEVIVLPVNEIPTIELPPVISFYEDQTLQLDFEQYITDDSDSLSLSVAGNENIVVDIDQLMVTFTPGYNWNGIEVMTFTVSDGDSSGFDVVNVNVIPVNDPPQINLPLEFVFNPNQSYSINFVDYVFDHDEDDLILTYSGNENIGVVIDNLSLIVTFITNGWLGVGSITFTVDDGQNRLTSFDIVDIIVTDDTIMPVIYLPDIFEFNEDSFPLPIDFNDYIYNDYNIQVNLSVVGNDSVTVEIDSLNRVTFSFVENWNGSEDITFTIDTPGYNYENSDITTVTVNPVNDAPVINLYEGFFFQEDGNKRVDFIGEGYVSDIDSDTLFINLIANSDDPNIDVVIVNDIATFTAAQDWFGEEQFTIFVNDGFIYRDQIFDVEVLSVNDTPVIDLPDSLTFVEDDSLDVDFNPYISDIDQDVLTISLVNETDYISAHIQGTMVRLTASLNWNGSEALVFSVNDMVGRAIDIDTVMVKVTPVNDAPVIDLPDSFTFAEDDSLIVDFEPLVSDVDLDDLVLTVTDGVNVSAAITGFSVVFTAGENWNGTEALTFTIDDQLTRLSAEASVNIIVTSVNDAPAIDLPDNFTFAEDDSLTVDFEPLVSDVELDNLVLTVTEGVNVSAAITGFSVVFTAGENWNGTEALTFTLDDQVTRLSTEAAVNIIVTPVNDAPVIDLPDSFTFAEDDSLIVDFEPLISDVDLDDLVLTVTEGVNVSAAITGFSVVFKAGENWNGTEALTFTIDDQITRLSTEAAVNIIVAPVNDPPQIVDWPEDGFTFAEDEQMVVDFTPYIFDIDSDSLTIIVSEGDSVQVTVNAYMVTFIPDENWFGTEFHEFTVADSEYYASENAPVIVTPVNDPPLFNLPAAFNAVEDTPLVVDFTEYITLIDNLIGDITIDSVGTYPNVDINILGTQVTFNPAQNFNGTVDISFIIDDGGINGFAFDNVNLVIAAVNDAPTIDLPPSFTFGEDSTLQVDFGQYINDIDSNNLTLSSQNADTINVNIDQFMVTFSAGTNWNGNENITFIVSDQITRATDDDVVNVIVTPINDAPKIDLPDRFRFNEDNSHERDFLSYISDVEEDSLSLIVSGNSNIFVVIDGFDVTFSTTYPDWFGSETLTFTVFENDARLQDSDDVLVVVTSVNDAPVINLPASVTVHEDGSNTFDFSDNINDVENDLLTLEAVGENIQVNIDGLVVEFIPEADWTGFEMIEFTVSDYQYSSTDNIRVIVSPENDAPVINLPDQFFTNEDTPRTINFSNFVSDVDNINLSLSVSDSENMVVIIDGFAVTILGNLNWNGQETLQFTVNDNVTRLTATDSVLIVVQPVNDAPVIILPASESVDEDGSITLDFSDYITDVDNDYSDLILIEEVGGLDDSLNVEIDSLIVTISPFTNWTGSEVIEFTVNDSQFSATDNMRVIVISVNDPPVIELPDSLVTPEDINLTIDFSSYVSDVDLDQLTLTVTGNENITVVIEGLAVTIQGVTNWHGQETLQFTVNDNVSRLSDTDDVLVIVESVNDAPVINLPASLIALEDSVHTFDFSEYIYDVDGDFLILTFEGNNIIDDFIIDSLNVTIVDNTWDVNENVLFSVSDGIASRFDVVNITLVPSGTTPSPGDAVVTVPSLDGLEPGEEFILPVNVNLLIESWEVFGIYFELGFDSDVLEYQGYNFEGTLMDPTQFAKSGNQFTFRDTIIFYEDLPDTTQYIVGTGALINLEFKYISTEYEQDVVEINEFEFHSPNPFSPTVFNGVINNDFPTLIDPALDDQVLIEDFATVSFDLQDFFNDNTPQSTLQFSVASASQDFAVTIDNNMMNIISMQDKYTTQQWPVKVVCWDIYLYSVRDIFLVTVNPVNDPPVISIINDFQVATNNQLDVDFNEYITDVDNNVATEVTINIVNTTDTSDPDIQLILFPFLPDLKTATFKGLRNWTGENSFEITASDPWSDSTPAGFNVAVIYEGSDDIHCFPNPMSSSTGTGTNFVINTVTPLLDISIDIYDFAGRKVCSKDFYGRGANEINWMGYTKGWNGSTAGTKLARGVYFAHVTGKDDNGAKALESVIKLVIKD